MYCMVPCPALRAPTCANGRNQISLDRPSRAARLAWAFGQENRGRCTCIGLTINKDGSMDTTVREHMRRLKSQISLLGDQIADEQCSQEQRNHLKTEIGIASFALAHYEAALRKEQRLTRLIEEHVRGGARAR